MYTNTPNFMRAFDRRFEMLSVRKDFVLKKLDVNETGVKSAEDLRRLLVNASEIIFRKEERQKARREYALELIKKEKEIDQRIELFMDELLLAEVS